MPLCTRGSQPVRLSLAHASAAVFALLLVRLASAEAAEAEPRAPALVRSEDKGGLLERDSDGIVHVDKSEPTNKEQSAQFPSIPFFSSQGSGRKTQRASTSTTNEPPIGFPHRDIVEASAVCGSQKYVTTCGWEDLEQTCVMTPSGQQRCYTGVCVCTGQQGCMEPVCTAPSPTLNLCNTMLCADGNSCLSNPGFGWSCWHPCNPNHNPVEYGPEMQPVVDAIRLSGACDKYNNPDSALYDLHLDAGIKMTAESWPFVGGESQFNAGGSSRRRADTMSRNQPKGVRATAASKNGAWRAVGGVGVTTVGVAALALAAA